MKDRSTLYAVMADLADVRGADTRYDRFGALDAPVSKRDADRIVERAHVVR